MRSAVAYRPPVWALALVAYVVIALVISVRVASAPATHLLGDQTSDAGAVARGLWVADVEHANPFSLKRDRYEGAPEGVPTATAVDLVEPIQPAGLWGLDALVGRVGSINLFLLLAVVATAMGGFFVASRALGVGGVAAFTAGFVTAFNPWVVEQASAGHLAFAMLLPLVALVGAVALVDVRRSVGAAALVGLAYGCCFLTAAYLGLVATAVVGTGLIVLLARPAAWADRLYVATLACVAAATAATVLIPGLVVYAFHRSETARIVGHAAGGRAAVGVWPQQYLNPGPLLAILGPLHVGSGSLAFGAAESVVFFGYVTPFLALWTVWAWRKGAFSSRGRVALSTIAVASWSAALAAVLSLPTHVGIGAFRFPLPSDILSALTSYYRIYSRFAIVVCICAALLASVAVDTAWRRRRPIGVGLALLVVLELWPSVLPAWSTASRPVDDWLRRHPGGIVATYPQPTDSDVAARLALADLAYQPQSRHPLYTLVSSGTGGTREAAIRILTRYLNDPGTPSLLAAERVRYVVVDTDAFAAEGATPPVPPTAAFRPVARIGADRVYALRAGVAPADVDQVLEQNAAAIAAVEGLPSPSLHYKSGFDHDGGAYHFAGSGTISFSNADARLRRGMLLMSASASQSTTVEALDAGAVIGRWEIGTAPTSVSFGPFVFGPGTTTVELRAEGGGSVTVQSLALQPWADFSVSLRAG